MKETISLAARPTRSRLGYCVSSVLVAVALSALSASSARAGTLYQSFGAFGLSGVSLANSTVSTGSYSGNATNLAVGGGKVYWQDGTSILDANTNLTGVTLLHTNNVAPADIAVDVADGVLYESFAGVGIFGVSLANPSRGAGGSYSGNATNLSIVGGKLYWEGGSSIYEANASNLSDVTLLHNNNVAPSDFAVDTADGVLYESFAGVGIFGVSLANPSRGAGGSQVGNVTNLAISGGKLYWQDGTNIFDTNAADLSDVTLFDTDSSAPTDIAIDSPAVVDAVPEPAAWGLLLVGLSVLVGKSRRRAM